MEAPKETSVTETDTAYPTSIEAPATGELGPKAETDKAGRPNTEAYAEGELGTETDAARVLKVAPGTLKKARIDRLQSNPLRDLPYVRIGRSIRYRYDDLKAWIDAHTIYPRDGGES